MSQHWCWPTDGQPICFEHPSKDFVPPKHWKHGLNWLIDFGIEQTPVVIQATWLPWWSAGTGRLANSKMGVGH